jgi:hypothetical protein
VRVLINGTLIGEATLLSYDEAELRFEIPPDILAEGEWSSLVVECPDANAPYAAMLSAQFKEIWIEKGES